MNPGAAACALLLLLPAFAAAQNGWRSHPLVCDEEAVLGGEGMLGEIVAGVTGGDGTVYLLDRGFVLVHRFDRDGKYLGPIGREGEGPGEFTEPRCLALAPDGTLYVGSANGTITALAADGSPGGRRFALGTARPVRDIAVDEEGTLYACSLDLTSHKVLHRRTPEGEPLGSFCDSFAVGEHADTMVESAYAGGSLCFAEDGTIRFLQLSPPVVITLDREGRVAGRCSWRADTLPKRPEPIYRGDSIAFRMGASGGRILALRGGAFLAQTFAPPEGGGEEPFRILDLYVPTRDAVFSSREPDGLLLCTAEDGESVYTAEAREAPTVVRYRLRYAF